MCEKTGQDIPYERLEAVPYARMTVEAQADMEDELETDAPSFEREFHEQVKDLSNKETVDQKAHRRMRFWIVNKIQSKNDKQVHRY